MAEERDAPAAGDDVVLWPAWGGVPEVFETATQVQDIACTAHEVLRSGSCAPEEQRPRASRRDSNFGIASKSWLLFFVPVL